MSEVLPDVPEKKPLMKSRLMTAVITAIAVALACVMIFAAILNPSMSPLASIHDDDGDTYPDSIDAFPDDPDEWNDADEDGVGDNSDKFPSDDNETADSDEDGVGDNADEFPEDPLEWHDTDGDGVGDNSDAFPNDSTESSDLDGDHVGDNMDDLPEDPTEWYDTDGDGVGDNSDAFPADADEDTPFVMLSPSLSFETMMISVEVNYTNKAVSWDVVMVVLSDGVHNATWNLTSSGLFEAMAMWDFGSTYLGDLNVILWVADYFGDGKLGANDALLFMTVLDEFALDVEYTVMLVYEPTMKSMASVPISAEASDTPTGSMSMVTYSTGYKFTIMTLSSSVTWDEVAILLDDGLIQGVWFPSTEALDEGITCIEELGPSYFMTFSVFLNVTDIAGNGEIDSGDYFTLTPGGGTWESGTDYTASLVYLPTFETICQMTFAG